ncbi:hypothetical protein [Streptomyces sp. B93]|uniref:hypothetical protein n=1 Tax=Streptomyces sp. B93 TaxID=2824875 RepID=UPI001B38F5EB|nr:hypothetical protein [Streptomyces sp. B93]MBQ1093494.1 hypothetical protein [Streptomyces sp. B93]
MFGTQRERDPVGGPFYKERGWISAALFLGFFLVMSLVAFVSDPKGVDLAETSREILTGLDGPLSPGDPQGVRGGPGGRPEDCATDDGDGAPPTAAPEDVEWRKLVAIMVPVSPSAGPLHTDATMWWCFAHTPTGAALAAHIIPVQLSGVSWRLVAQQQVVPGAPRDTFVAGKAESGTAVSEDSAIGRFVGFSVASYSGDLATVRLLVTDPMGGYLSTSVSVRWRDGDWKVALRDDGSLYSSVERQATTEGFTLWGA